MKTFTKPIEANRVACEICLKEVPESQEIDAYVVQPAGAYRYDAGTRELRLAAAGDHRATTGVQDFVTTAPVNLVYVDSVGYAA